MILQKQSSFLRGPISYYITSTVYCPHTKQDERSMSHSVRPLSREGLYGERGRRGVYVCEQGLRDTKGTVTTEKD